MLQLCGDLVVQVSATRLGCFRRCNCGRCIWPFSDHSSVSIRRIAADKMDDLMMCRLEKKSKKRNTGVSPKAPRDCDGPALTVMPK